MLYINEQKRVVSERMRPRSADIEGSCMSAQPGITHVPRWWHSAYGVYSRKTRCARVNPEVPFRSSTLFMRILVVDVTVFVNVYVKQPV